MCGILAYLKQGEFSEEDAAHFKATLEKLRPRGPDELNSETISADCGYSVMLGFARLAIVDPTHAGMQPFDHGDTHLICNGEIYDQEAYRKQFPDYEYRSKSDCEVLLPAFEHYGSKLFKLLDAEYAGIFVTKTGIYVARDYPGIRPLFYGKDVDGDIIAFASEAKALQEFPLITSIAQFLPGHYWYKDFASGSETFTQYYTLPSINDLLEEQPRHNLREMLRNTLLKSVKDRLISDQPICFMLSGGLDSSIVVSCARFILGPDVEILTYSIGLADSKDAEAAADVADYLKTTHTNVTITFDEAFAAIPAVINALESHCQTTIRASTMQWLLAKWIRENTKCEVILTGDGADELFLGYAYDKLCPKDDLAYIENKSLVDNLHKFDVLRSDRAIASNSLEGRVPFLSREMINFSMSLPMDIKRAEHNDWIEKAILREAFDCTLPGQDNVPSLPKKLLWRPKEAFSDGVGHSWSDGIKKRIKETTKCASEDEYYREIYDTKFKFDLTEEHWRPKWTTVKDSSARFLQCYNAQ
jgi:asparagine synthase (glutamine-hydrolysing)